MSSEEFLRILYDIPYVRKLVEYVLHLFLVIFSNWSSNMHLSSIFYFQFTNAKVKYYDMALHSLQLASW